MNGSRLIFRFVEIGRTRLQIFMSTRYTKRFIYCVGTLQIFWRCAPSGNCAKAADSITFNLMRQLAGILGLQMKD
jgi:hypothetical protein